MPFVFQTWDQYSCKKCIRRSGIYGYPSLSDHGTDIEAKDHVRRLVQTVRLTFTQEPVVHVHCSKLTVKFNKYLKHAFIMFLIDF